MARFQDFVNIQKEISEHLLAQKHLYEQIGRINRDVEDRVIKRRQSELKMLNVIQAQNVKYNDLVAKRGTLQGAAAERLEGQIASTLQLIKYNRELIDLSKLASEVEMGMAKKQYEEGNKWFKFVGTETQKILGLDLKQFEAVKATGDKMLALGNNTEAMAYSVGAVVMMLTGAFALFKKLDTAAWDFRKAMGMTRKDSVAIRAQSERMAIDFMHLGVNASDAYKAFQTLGQAVGGVHNVTKSMAEDVAIVAAQLGISAEVSTAFMRNLAAVSKSSMEAQVNSMYIAQSMSAAAGVNLGQVMGDVATKSSETLTMMSRLPNAALRTAIELRRMGTDMDKAANSSRHILDFTENVNEEMEASVLLGRSINLQRARELAYRRDLEGSTKEILRITKSVNFENLDVFQQEAFAKATGKSVDELLEMLQASKQIEQVKRSGTPQQKEQLALYEKMRQENEAAAKARAKDVSADLRRMGNQERLVQIQNKWNALLAKAQEFLLPVIDKLLGGALALLDWAPPIMAFTKSLEAGLLFLGGWISKTTVISDIFLNIAIWVGKLGPKFAFLEKIVLAIGSRAATLFGWIGKSSGFLGRFVGVFAKVLGPIGWVIMAFQGISGFIKGWNASTGSWIQKLGGGLMGALRGIIPGFDYIVKAVKWIGGWIGKIVVWSFKWLTLPGLLIQAYKGLKKLFPETFAAIENLLGKVWGAFTKILGVGWQIAKMMFGAWWSGVKLMWSGIKMVWNAFAEPIAAIWGMVKSFFGLIGAYWRAYVSGPIEKFFGAFTGGLDHMLASIINGFASLAGSIWHALTDPFKAAWNWVKELWGGNSPSRVGMSILQGIVSIGSGIFDALTAPFRKGMAWIMDKIPGMGKVAEKIRGGVSGGGSVEKRATAAYIPAVTVTPEGTKIAKAKDKDKRAGEKEKDESAPMSEETGLKIVTLLEKILAKDTNVSMDGQLLSTHLARQTEFRGGYGVNKVA